MEQRTAAAADGLIIPLGNGAELRSVRVEDAAELFAAVERNCERLGRWLPFATPGYRLEDMKTFLVSRHADAAKHEGLTTTIVHDGAPCGLIELHKIDRPNRSTSIGYWIDQAHEGRGIVTAACRAIVTEGFRNFGLHRIEIRCATRNDRSRAIPLRLGFVEEGILREAEWLHDRWVDLRVFRMLSRDWPE